MRIMILCAGLVLAGCQTTQTLPAVAPLACPPILVQPIEAQPSVPDAAGTMEWVQTETSLAGADAYLAYVEQLARWGRDGWSRAVAGRVHCGGGQ